LIVPQGPEAAVASLAVASATTCVPLNPSFRPRELEQCLSAFRVSAVIIGPGVGSSAREVALGLGLRVIELTVDPGEPGGVFALSGRRQGTTEVDGFARPEDIAFLLPTSGTTSRPKLVPITHAALRSSAERMGTSLRLTSSDRCLDVMPLFHIHGLMAAVSAFRWGGSVVCPPIFDPSAFFAWLEEFRPTFYTAVPTIHQTILSEFVRGELARGDGSLRLIRSCSAPLPPRVLTELEQTFRVPVIEAYGMTEAAHQIASNPLPPRTRKPRSVGVAEGRDLSVAILDATGRPVPPGETGEIAIRGAGVTAGYLDDPEANANAFVEGWLRTGDEGHLDEEGYLFITGRRKELINRGGEKIAPREIDETLLEHPAVAEAVAFAAPHPVLGEEVAAAVVLRPGVSVTEDGLRGFVAARLADFKIPRHVVVVSELPRGASGKVQRLGLADKLGLAGPRRQPFVAPRDPLEAQLAKAFEASLRVAQVGIKDGFFDLGGHSMMAMRLFARIERSFGRRLPVTTLFEASTVEQLAQLLRRDGWQGSWSSLVPIQPLGTRRPLFCVHPHVGTVLCYKDLARHLGLDQPLFGLQARGLDGSEPPLTRVEDMAAHYLTELRTVQPAGPYALAGYCIGGTIAYEMAQQLLAQGESVALLAMFDASSPRTLVGAGTHHRAFSNVVGKFETQLSRLASMSRGTRLPYLGRKLKRVFSEARRATRLALEKRLGTGRTMHRTLRHLEDVHGRALAAYAPRTYPGDVVLFRARQPTSTVEPPDAQLGWGALVRGTVRIHDVPGATGDAVQEPRAGALATLLKGYLDTAQSEPPVLRSTSEPGRQRRSG
jgi:acyl-CoA synthetase (AMP-forming)/AMP-acid ligase II/thioesterase domain-containing protein/acyl carrier protein